MKKGRLSKWVTFFLAIYEVTNKLYFHFKTRGLGGFEK